MQTIVESPPSASESHFAPLIQGADAISEIKAALSERIGEIRFVQWFGPQTRFEMADGTLTVLAPSAFVAQWIRGHFTDDLRRMALTMAGITDVEIRADGQDISPAGRAAASISGAAPLNRELPAATRPSNPLRLNPQFTLDRFISGVGNRMALHAAKMLVASPEKIHGPLFIHGNCGLGKTHLLQGICRGWAESFPQRPWRYVTAEQFTNEFLENIKKGTMGLFRRRMRRIDLLVVDDAHFFSRKASTQQEFLHTFNEIIAAGGKIVLAADCAPRDVTDITEALASRLMSGLVVRIDLPDVQTKAAILRQAAESRGWTISDVVINRLSREPVANVRELEGRLTQTLMRQTVGSASAVLPPQPNVDSNRDELPPEASVDVILQATAEYLGQELAKLTGGCRSAECARARGIAMYLLRELAHRSYPEIGRTIGVKSHSAVINACQRISHQIEVSHVLMWRVGGALRSASVAQVVADITARIRQLPRTGPRTGVAVIATDRISNRTPDGTQ
ncbi:MAG: DnaA ATPase domain-containing protein [Phycisphaerae bacterium]